jgi:UDP-N-acetyl-D-glucosamine dehydrogenase
LRTLNYSARFIELASEINGHMPEVVVRRASAILNQAKKSVKGSKIFVLGVAYKKDTGDTRESPALDVIRLLQDEGASVSFHDPYSNTIRAEDGRTEKGSALSPRSLGAADLVVIITDHSVYDYTAIVKGARRILDTRNATRAVKAGRAKIEKL